MHTHQLGQITLHGVWKAKDGKFVSTISRMVEVLPSRFLLGENGCNFELFIYTHRIHVWYIYLDLVDVLMFMVNVGKYTIHGWYGIPWKSGPTLLN